MLRMLTMPKPSTQVTRHRLVTAGFFFLALSIFAVPSFAQASRERDLARRIRAIITKGNAKRAFWGIEVYSLDQKKVLYRTNSRRNFTPASVTKLFTTAAAMSLIGKRYRFKTTLETLDRIDEDGRLLGDLILVGRGDPDLAGCTLPFIPPDERRVQRACSFSKTFNKMASQLVARGVKLVTGNLVMDSTYFAPEHYSDGWAFNDVQWSYGAPISALSFADNTLTIRVEPGDAVDDQAKLFWEPFTRYYKIQNAAWTAPEGSKTRLRVIRAPGSRKIEVSGPIEMGSRRRFLTLAFDEPPAVAGELLLQALERAGVRVLGEVEVRHAPPPPVTLPSQVARQKEQNTPDKSSTNDQDNETERKEEIKPRVLAEHRSLPLAEVVRLVLKDSQNLYTEMLLRMLGRRQPPKTGKNYKEPERSDSAPPLRRADGSTEAGLAVMRAWLYNAGVDYEDIGFFDGSGLSRKGLVSPHAVVHLLRYADTRSWKDWYFESLPIAGEDGTLRRRMRGTPAEGRVRAKTGTLGRDLGLAGLVETIEGERLAFAILLNHHRLRIRDATKLVDDICVALAELPAPPKPPEPPAQKEKQD